MADSDLRTLERRFRETGAVEDEAAWLRARVRAGTLDPDRLDLAAWLDHPGARAALGKQAPEQVPGPEHWTSVEAPALAAFVERLDAEARAVCRRALDEKLSEEWQVAYPDAPELQAYLDEVAAQVSQSWFLDAVLRRTETTGRFAPIALAHLRADRLDLAIGYAATATGGAGAIHAVLRDALMTWALDPNG